MLPQFVVQACAPRNLQPLGYIARRIVAIKIFNPMPAVSAGPEIERLIQLLARLPGLGPRSARRAALFLIKKRELLMAPLAAALQTAIEKISVCRVCGNIDPTNQR